VFLNPKRNFDGDVRIVGWAVRDWRDRHLLTSVGLRIRIINGKNNGARPILAPLGLPSLLFFFPEVRIRNNEAGFRLGKSGHDSSHPQLVLFLVQELVEVIVSRTHLRALDRISDFRRQIVDPVGAAFKGAKPLQLIELACGYEVPAHPTVAGNGDRLVLRLFLVAPKALSEFSSGNGSHGKTRKLRMMSNLRKIDLTVKRWWQSVREPLQ